MHVCSSWRDGRTGVLRVWEARQVRTAARPAIENVVIAATAVLSGHFQSNLSADEETIVRNFFTTRLKTV